MNSSRQMQELSFYTRIYVPTDVTCPLSFPRGFKEINSSNHPAGCFLLNG